MSNKTQDILNQYKSAVMPTYSPSVVLASGVTTGMMPASSISQTARGSTVTTSPT